MIPIFLFKDVKYKDIIDIKRLDIKKYKVTCILGESGSGKTTLLRLLNKLISCESGEIKYKYQSLKDIDSIELRREIVMLPQSTAIFKGSIKDNLLIGLRFSEKPPVSDNELYQILKTVNLNKNLTQDAEKLSGGEKQRIALARVIIMRPEVLLLDEPSSALDDETEHMIIAEVVNYSKENNKSLIMVTHSKRIANTFADEIIRIKEGMVIDGEGNKR